MIRNKLSPNMMSAEQTDYEPYFENDAFQELGHAIITNVSFKRYYRDHLAQLRDSYVDNADACPIDAWRIRDA
jgi:CRISPR/Cas system type I-B associated protein Csh2 (Cas7 group RAMP superfamily)